MSTCQATWNWGGAGACIHPRGHYQFDTPHEDENGLKWTDMAFEAVSDNPKCATCGHARVAHGSVWRTNVLVLDSACWVLEESKSSEYCPCKQYKAVAEVEDASDSVSF